MVKKEVIIYTDGACVGNPGPGGYGAVIIDDGIRTELSGGFRKTTNNRMELLAAIHALRTVEGAGRKIVIHSDSKLLVDAFNQHWIESWVKRNWRKSDGNAVLNKDLWEELVKQSAKHKVTFKWVKGHVGVPENERCDELATNAASMDGLPSDTTYEGLPGIPIYEILPQSEGVASEVLKSEECSLGSQKFTFSKFRNRQGDIAWKIFQSDESNTGAIIIVESNRKLFIDTASDFFKE